MASCSGNGSRGHHKFTLNVNETYTSGGADNYSTVSWSLVLSPIQTGWDWNYSNNVPVKYSVIIHEKTYEGNIMQYDGSSTVTVASGTLNITHDSDGSKAIAFSFAVWDNVSTSYLPGSASGNGTLTLTKIARYAAITQFDLSSGLETITVTWGADAACDSCQYSINGGGWAGGLSWPSGTINGLNPNTKYDVKIRVKRTDSQLWTESAAKSITTKNIATVSSAPNINFGDTAKVVMANPSGATKNLRIECGGSTVVTRNSVANEVTVTLTDSEWDTIYKKLGTSSSITIRYVVDTKGSSTYYNYVDRTLTLKGNQKTIRTNVSGTWKRGKIWTNVNGTWRRGVIWTNVNGTWRRGI